MADGNDLFKIMDFLTRRSSSAYRAHNRFLSATLMPTSDLGGAKRLTRPLKND
jgi:hypothetical protein